MPVRIDHITDRLIADAGNGRPYASAILGVPVINEEDAVGPHRHTDVTAITKQDVDSIAQFLGRDFDGILRLYLNRKYSAKLRYACFGPIVLKTSPFSEIDELLARVNAVSC